MSELIQKNDNRATMRWKLLTGASALALMAYVSSAGMAIAEDANRPEVWIELSGQLSKLDSNSEIFAPDFLSMRPSIFSPSRKFESSPVSSFDEEGKISFQPDNSDWILSASIQYGRALKDRHVHQQTYPSLHGYSVYVTPPRDVYLTAHPKAARFADTKARNNERHTVLDFQAGKDVGLGLFGRDSSSVVSVGVRFAQFRSKSNITLKSNPDWAFHDKYYNYYSYRFHFITQPYHSNMAGFRADRSFHGVGPSLSWSGSVPFAGNSQDSELDFDWGVNAAILFGRQKTRTQHHTTVRYQTGVKYGHVSTPTRLTPPPNVRSHNVTVPNIGGFGGISFRYADAKISLGYKADFFFGAIDGGIDMAKKENRAFFGPYASISIGLGD